MSRIAPWTRSAHLGKGAFLVGAWLTWIVVILLGVTTVRHLRAGLPCERLGETKTVTVLVGDTLWDLARRHLPETDPRWAVEAIRTRNELSDLRLQPGDQLLVPSCTGEPLNPVRRRPLGPLGSSG